MSRQKRSAKLAGIALALIIALCVVLVLRMNRQRQEHRQVKDSVRTIVRGDDKESGPLTGEEREVIQKREKSEQPLEETGYSIFGRVVDEEGEPISGAEVILCSRFSRMTFDFPELRREISDKKGRFRFDECPREDLHLNAEKDGYFFHIQGLGERLRLGLYPVRYKDGTDRVEKIVLVMIRGTGIIGGRVIDQDALPVTNATVWLARYPTFKKEVRTSTDGSFRATGLLTGAYWVWAKADGYITMPLGQRENQVWTGTEDLVLRLESGVRVHGVIVLAKSGGTVAGAEVVPMAYRTYEPGPGSSRSFSSVGIGTVETDTQGCFEIVVCPNEDTRLTAYWGDYYSERETVVHAEKDESPPPVTIRLVQGGRISGKVVDDDTDEPVEGVSLLIGGLHTLRYHTYSDENGDFAFSGVKPGELYIFVESEEYRYPTRGFPVNVVKAEETSGIEVRVSRKQEIAGVVIDEDGGPISGAVIRPGMQQSSYTSEQDMAVTGPEGRFVVREGRVKTIEGLLVTHAEFAHKYVDVPVDPAARKPIEVVLTRGGMIYGCVYDENASPLVGIEVVLGLLSSPVRESSYRWDNRAHGMELKTAMTDNTGSYRFHGIAEGRYQVIVKVRL